MYGKYLILVGVCRGLIVYIIEIYVLCISLCIVYLFGNCGSIVYDCIII